MVHFIGLNPHLQGHGAQSRNEVKIDETFYPPPGLEYAAKHKKGKHIEENMRSVAAGFLINGDMIRTKIGSLSEGQKGLVAFARLVLQKPGLLILDEPTNHINFRHLPIIAKALNDYDGAMILVSHVPEFVKQIRIDEVLDLEN